MYVIVIYNFWGIQFILIIMVHKPLVTDPLLKMVNKPF